MGSRHGARAEWRWKTGGGMDMRFEVQIRRYNRFHTMRRVSKGVVLCHTVRLQTEGKVVEAACKQRDTK
eukprot:gene82-12906_t